MRRYVISLLACFLLMNMLLPNEAIACCPPPGCDRCEACDGEQCHPDHEGEDCGIQGAEECKKCSSGECVYRSGNDCEQNSDCENCDRCVDCVCTDSCESDYCESCIDDSCKVCGGDTNKACCDGTCYNLSTQGCCNGTVYNLSTKKCCPGGSIDDFICDKEKTCCDGQCCDPDCELCCDGTCCDVSNCEICKNGTCVRAVPTNMHQTYVEDLGNGTLYFEYEWDSTTGDLADLGNCTVGEKVDYPGGNPYYWPSPPWVGSTPNPTIINLSAVGGMLIDTHTTKSFIKPYQNESFSANQIYRYHCGPDCCMNPGVYVTLLNIGSIFRAVTEGEGDVWRYSIIKSGAYAEILPLP